MQRLVRRARACDTRSHKAQLEGSAWSDAERRQLSSSPERAEGHGIEAISEFVDAWAAVQDRACSEVMTQFVA